MAAYALTHSAQEDLIGIWLYTCETWSEQQADRYQDDLHGCFERLASGMGHSKSLPEMDGVKSHLCRHHYVFFLERPEDIVILAVLHERMDLMERLRERL